MSVCALKAEGAVRSVFLYWNMLLYQKLIVTGHKTFKVIILCLRNPIKNELQW